MAPCANQRGVNLRDPPPDRRCGAETQAGTPCTNWGRLLSGRCRMHGESSLRGIVSRRYMHRWYSRCFLTKMAARVAALRDEAGNDTWPRLIPDSNAPRPPPLMPLRPAAGSLYGQQPQCVLDSVASFAADPVHIPVEPMRVRRRYLKPAEADLPAIQVRQRCAQEEERVVHGVVGRLRLVLVLDLLEVLHVPAQSPQQRLDEDLLDVLLADGLVTVPGDPLRGQCDDGLRIAHHAFPPPRPCAGRLIPIPASESAETPGRSSQTT